MQVRVNKVRVDVLCGLTFGLNTIADVFIGTARNVVAVDGSLVKEF